jgi:hypothetical protein
MRHPAYQVKPFRTDAGVRVIRIIGRLGTLKHEFIPDYSLPWLKSWKSAHIAHIKWAAGTPVDKHNSRTGNCT